MKGFFSALAIATLLALSVGPAQAAPGDPRVVQGTLEWPATFSAESFVIVRGEDGRLYYTDVSAAQRRVAGPLRAGSRVAVLGVEANRPWEVAAIVFGPGDAASLGLAPPAGSAPAPAPPTGGVASAAPEPMWRLDGTVQSISGSMVSLRTDEGRTQAVDASQLSSLTLRTLRQGDRITLFGVPRSDNKLVATGYVQSEPATPAASPSSR
jgi:hypothetical protein